MSSIFEAYLKVGKKEAKVKEAYNQYMMENGYTEDTVPIDLDTFCTEQVKEEQQNQTELSSHIEPPSHFKGARIFAEGQLNEKQKILYDFLVYDHNPKDFIGTLCDIERQKEDAYLHHHQPSIAYVELPQKQKHEVIVFIIFGLDNQWYG